MPEELKCATAIEQENYKVVAKKTFYIISPIIIKINSSIKKLIKYQTSSMKYRIDFFKSRIYQFSHINTI